MTYLCQFVSDGRDETANRNGSNRHSAVPNNEGTCGGQERNREEYETWAHASVVICGSYKALGGGHCPEI
jgi:hypothetical protein